MELLVVLLSVLLIVTIMLPAIHRSREQAKVDRWEGYMRSQRVREQMVLQWMMVDSIGTEIVRNYAQGNQIEDYRREAHFGTLHGGVAWAAGRWYSKKALEFDGLSGRVISDRLDMVAADSGEYTLITWIKAASAGAQTLVASTCTDTVGHGTVNLSLDAHNRLVTRTEDGLQVSPLSVGTDVWTMVAMVQTRDGITLWRMADDDILSRRVGDGQMHTNAPAEASSAFLVGSSRRKIPENPFKGRLDELVVYRRALSADDLQEAYRIGRP